MVQCAVQLFIRHNTCMSHLLCKGSSQIWSDVVCSVEEGLGWFLVCLGGLTR